MKTRKIFAAAILAGAVCSVQAHMFWVDGVNDEKTGKFVAKMGYSDDFPNYEPIMQERVHLFAPVTLIHKDGQKKRASAKRRKLPLRGRKAGQRHIYPACAAKSDVFAKKAQRRQVDY